MQDKRILIKEMEYFNAYRDTLVSGFTVNEILEHKLFSSGFYYDDNGFSVPEDIFYCSTDFIEKYISKKGKLFYVPVDNASAYYSACESIRLEINTGHLENGVKIMSLYETYIDFTVKIAPDTVIYPNCHLEDKTYIANNCIIGPGTIIRSSKIGSNTSVVKSVVEQSSTGDNCNVGPYAHLRPGSVLKDNVKAGSFVELKNVTVGDNTRIPHLAYTGDSEIGKDCNISCGVITANYDGKEKHATKIGDHVFVGCNSTLIAPVELEDDVYVAAGSNIVDNVKKGELAIARAYQTNKQGWMEKTGRLKKT